MTVVVLCGLPCSGKGVVAEVLRTQFAFRTLRLGPDGPHRSRQADGALEGALAAGLVLEGEGGSAYRGAEELLEAITARWRENAVVLGVSSWGEAEVLMKRPFVLLVHVTAPTTVRYGRHVAMAGAALSLEAFVERDDRILYEGGMAGVVRKCSLEVNNPFASIEALLPALSTHLPMALSDAAWTRPSWDSYYMAMAELVSRRSNCMKRRVGSVVVFDKRVVATGYNGTATGLTNCTEGGCERCNGNAPCGVDLDRCSCLHAEENALLEAGRARAVGATVYCTTVPCLGCARKIIQCGIVRVVYALEYSPAHDSLSAFARASVSCTKVTAASAS